MNSFLKKVRTQAEKDELLRQARVDWDKLGVHQHLIAACEEDFLAKFVANIEVESTFVAPAPMTGVEKAAIERKLNHNLDMQRLFGDRWAGDHWADDSTGCKVLDDAWRQHQAAELEKFLAPAQRAQNSLSEMIEKAVEEAVDEALRKSARSGNLESNREPIAVRPVSEREALAPMARMAAEQDPNSDVARFLAAYIVGDEKAQRRIVRELVQA